MEKTLIVYRTSTNDYAVQEVVHEGVPHIIVPVIMMVEGVHAGSRGPLLHLAEDLGRFPESWNGIPITIQHPQQNDTFVSANSPTVLAQELVGRVYNTAMAGNRLTAEVWLNVARMTEMSPEALQRIMDKQPIDVSVGVFTEEEEAPGNHNGTQYTAIARNHRPDHLAILPNEEGACNWNDGCGIRVNKKSSTFVNQNNNNMERTKFQEKKPDIGQLLTQAFKSPGSEEAVKALETLTATGINMLQINQVAFRDTMSKIQSKLDAMDTDTQVYYLREVYDDGTFIYRISFRQGPDRFYRRNYVVQTDGNIEFEGEPVEVIQKVEFININTKQMAKNENNPCCPDKVTALINNAATKFTEDNREWLLTQTAETIEMLTPAEVKKEVIANTKTPVTKEEALAVLSKSKMTNEDFFGMVPPEMAEQMQNGLNLHKAHKAKVVESIIANTAENTWDKVELEAMKIEVLEKIAKSTGTEQISDYTGNGFEQKTPTVNANDESVMLPMGVNAEEKKDKE